MHEDYEVVRLVIPPNPSEDELAEISAAMGEWQEVMIEDQKKIAAEFGVSDACAGYIQYLRGRSRWTQEKENELICLDKEGEPLPNVCAGEF